MREGWFMRGRLGRWRRRDFSCRRQFLAMLPETATIAQEEIFGPVLSAIRARDLTDALAIANGTKYALTGGIYSRSPSVDRAVRAGISRGEFVYQSQDHGERWWIGSRLVGLSCRDWIEGGRAGLSAAVYDCRGR